VLARPTALDQLEIRAPGWDVFGGTCEDRASLHEGESCERWLDAIATTEPIVITGRLWGHRVTRVVQPDPTQQRTIARLLVGAQTAPGELEDDVDRAAHAVSSEWSLFARWGGADDDGADPRGRSSSPAPLTDARVGTMSSGHVSVARPARVDLRPQLLTAAAACRASGARVTVHVETTREEIVDVTADVVPDPGMSAHAAGVVRTCVEEAVWRTLLVVPNPPEHALTEVTL
jgi:hypothetical protein